MMYLSEASELYEHWDIWEGRSNERCKRSMKPVVVGEKLLFEEFQGKSKRQCINQLDIDADTTGGDHFSIDEYENANKIMI
jgi:hypothetical protein